MILSSPPQFGQCSRSISKAKLQRRLTCTQVMSQLKTRLSSRAQPMRAGRRCSQPGSVVAGSDAQASSCGHAGTTSARSLAELVKDGASTPWNRIRCRRGRGTGAWGAPFGRPCRQALHELQRRHHDVRGAVAPGGLQLQHDLPGAVALHPLVGQRRPRDGAAKLLQRLAVIGAAAHGGVQAETQSPRKPKPAAVPRLAKAGKQAGHEAAETRLPRAPALSVTRVTHPIRRLPAVSITPQYFRTDQASPAIKRRLHQLPAPIRTLCSGLPASFRRPSWRTTAT